MGWDITFYCEVPALKQIASMLSKEFEKISNRIWKLLKVLGTSRKAREVSLGSLKEIWGWPKGWHITFYNEVPFLKQLASNFTLLCTTFHFFETYFDPRAIWEGSLWVVNYWWRTTFSFVVVRSFFPQPKGQLGPKLVKETTYLCFGHR